MSYWRRTRMISFRVSEREFEMLKSKSESEGARSVSDFARDALCGRGGNETARGEPAETATLADLKDRISELNETVRRVAEMIEQSSPSRPENLADATDAKDRNN